MKKVTQTELAALCGVTRQAISDALKHGRLRKMGEARNAGIDLHDYLTTQYMKKNDQRTSSVKKKEVKAQKEGSFDEDLKDIVENKEILRKKYLAESNQSDDKGGNNYYAESDKTTVEVDKIKMQTQKLEIEVAEKMNILIDRERVRNAFNKMSSVMYNYFHTLGDRMAPVAAGICGCNDKDAIFKVKSQLDLEIMRGLKEFKRISEGEL